MSGTSTKIVAAALVMLTTGLLASAGVAQDKRATRVPLPVVKIHQGERCVEPTEVMRRDHMKFILHQRDETMHRGIRTSKHSLKECVNCHADPKTGSVLGRDGFCASCHTYAAVSIDCFSCHTDKAQNPPAAAVTTGFRARHRAERLARETSAEALP